MRLDDLEDLALKPDETWMAEDRIEALKAFPTLAKIAVAARKYRALIHSEAPKIEVFVPDKTLLLPLRVAAAALDELLALVED